jgi:hypothetical protein
MSKACHPARRFFKGRIGKTMSKEKESWLRRRWRGHRALLLLLLFLVLFA